jgi:hypothetical protein
VWTSDVGESSTYAKTPENPPQKNSKIGANFIASSMQENFFFRFFYRIIVAGKLFIGFFYRFIGAGKPFFGFSIASSMRENFFSVFSIASSVQENFFSVFSIASSVQENFFSVFSIASSVKKTLPFKIVSLYSIFFSKIVYQDRFNRYIFEYRCPSLLFCDFFMIFYLRKML